MRLTLLQVGEPVLRQKARPLTSEEITSKSIQELIVSMQETLREAPGVGLAAPQIGVPIQLAIIEDLPEYHRELSQEEMAARERRPVPFHVIINPSIKPVGDMTVEFFEGCLSVNGFMALVPRAREVIVECLDEHGRSQTIRASGWYARILQHEIDHLNGTIYIDRMHSRSFMSLENYKRYWKDRAIAELRERFRGGENDEVLIRKS
jgi:peptide deformylase